MIVNTAVYHKPLHVPVSTVSSLSKKVPLPTKNSNLSDPLFDHHIQAIVYIASARYADRLLTLLAIRSARTIGNWKKEIFVLTDMRRCFSGEEVTPISVISEVDSSDSMKSKRFKAKIFEYLPSHIRRVLYLDADIIIGRDLTEFDRLSAELSKEHPDAHMFCYPEMDSPPQAVRETVGNFDIFALSSADHENFVAPFWNYDYRSNAITTLSQIVVRSVWKVRTRSDASSTARRRWKMRYSFPFLWRDGEA